MSEHGTLTDTWLETNFVSKAAEATLGDIALPAATTPATSYTVAPGRTAHIETPKQSHPQSHLLPV